MPGRLVEAIPEAWEYAGALVQHGREARGLKIEEAAAQSAGRISRSVWSLLENAGQKNGRMAAESLAGASEVLGLPPSTLEDLVLSSVPTMTPREAWTYLSGEGTAGSKPDIPLAERVTALEAEMADIRAVVEALAKGSP